jgi:hypothetical protein
MALGWRSVMRNVFIRIAQFVALLLVFGLLVWVLERAYTGLTRSHKRHVRDAFADHLPPG